MAGLLPNHETHQAHCRASQTYVFLKRLSSDISCPLIVRVRFVAVLRHRGSMDGATVIISGQGLIAYRRWKTSNSQYRNAAIFTSATLNATRKDWQ